MGSSVRVLRQAFMDGGLYEGERMYKENMDGGRWKMRVWC